MSKNLVQNANFLINAVFTFRIWILSNTSGQTLKQWQAKLFVHLFIMKFWYFLIFVIYSVKSAIFLLIIQAKASFLKSSMHFIFGVSTFVFLVDYLCRDFFLIYLRFADRISGVLQETRFYKLLHMGMSSIKGWRLYLVLPSWNSEDTKIW